MNRLIAQLLALSILLTSAPATHGADMVWRELDAENTVFVELDEGRIIIELNPVFAPRTVEQFRKLVLSRFYDGLSFYRVIDGFVAQGGDGSDLGELSEVPLIDSEFQIEWPEDHPWQPVQKPDFYAPETGFSDGFPVARDPQNGIAWLTHCPGAVAMARNDDRDSSRTDFYIVMGQAPRYLDRNLTVFGRVVDGMDVVQRIRRGSAEANGIIRDDLGKSRIRSMKLLSEWPREERLHVLTMDTSSKPFKNLLKDRRHRKQDFFVNQPPKVLDVCQVPVAARITK